jgi:MFS family permease
MNRDAVERKSVSSPTDEPAAMGPRRWYALALLTSILTVHFIDRNVIGVVIEPLKKEFGFSDSMIGVLAGFAHSAALGIMVLPVGWLADRLNRVRLVAAMVMLWSALTGLGALASNYISLLLMRVGVGAAEAGCSPASVSLIADLFSSKERPTAVGLYYVGAGLGTGLVFLVGGYLAQHFGWRTVFLLAGLPGIVLGLLLLFTVCEPLRKNAGKAATPTMREAVRELGANRAVQLVLAAGCIATMAQSSAWIWMASLMVRTHGMSLAQAGLVVAASAALGKTVGSACSGPLTRWLSRDLASRLWRYPAAALVCSIPVAWAMVMLPSAAAAVVCAMALGLLLGGWAPQIQTILVSLVPDSLRATSLSLWHLGSNIFGVGVGPFLTGALSDWIGGSKGLGYAIGWTVTLNSLAALFIWMSSSRQRVASLPSAALS